MYTKLYLQVLITRKNDVFVTKIAYTYQTKIFTPIFALADRLPTSANLPFQKVTIPQFYMRPDLFSVWYLFLSPVIGSEKKSILSRWNIVFAESFKSWRKKRPLRQTYTVLHRGFLWKEPGWGTNIPQIINQNVKLKNACNGIVQAPGLSRLCLPFNCFLLSLLRY